MYLNVSSVCLWKNVKILFRLLFIFCLALIIPNKSYFKNLAFNKNTNLDINGMVYRINRYALMKVH